jgi:hypothetical protein
MSGGGVRCRIEVRQSRRVDRLRELGLAACPGAASETQRPHDEPGIAWGRACADIDGCLNTVQFIDCW